MELMEIIALGGLYKSNENKRRIQDLQLQYKLENDEDKKEIILDQIKEIQISEAKLAKGIMKASLILLIGVPVFFLFIYIFLAMWIF